MCHSELYLYRDGRKLFFAYSVVYFVFSSQKINEKPQVVMDYESGKAIPNNQVLSKLERTLGELM